MKYFLGYRKNNEFVPIKLNMDSSLEKIVDLVKFTNQFETEEELIEELMNYDTNLNYEDKLYYLKQDGTKGNYSYVPISDGTIYTSKYNKFFNYNGIYSYIHKNLNNLEFIDSLFNFVIENSNIKVIIYNYLNSLDRTHFNIFINKLLKCSIDVDLRILINEYNNMSNSTDIDIYQKINDIKRKITDSSTTMKLLYMSSNKDIKFSQAPMFVRHMENLYTRLFNYYRNGDAHLFDYDYYQDISIESQLTYFLHSFIYQKDRNNKYKIDCNGYKIYNGSILFKLGKFLSQYEDYRLIEEKRITDEFQEEYGIYINENNLDEEFLTKEDFDRIGIDPEEAGYKRK